MDALTEYFTGLHERDQAALMSACRGFDPDPEGTLKREVVQRFRGIAMGMAWPNPCDTEPLIPETLPLIEASANRLHEDYPDAAEHFLGHLREAVEASRGHEVWDGLEDRLIQALRPHQGKEE